MGLRLVEIILFVLSLEAVHCEPCISWDKLSFMAGGRCMNPVVSGGKIYYVPLGGVERFIENSDGREYCENSLNATYPIIRSNEENEALKYHLTQNDMGTEVVWIGATVNKSAGAVDLFWFDGSKSAFAVWRVDPRWFQNGMYNVAISMNDGGTWMMIQNTTTEFLFVCEKKAEPEATDPEDLDFEDRDPCLPMPILGDKYIIGPRSYYFFQTLHSWIDAMDVCKSVNGSLMSSDYENEQLMAGNLVELGFPDSTDAGTWMGAVYESAKWNWVNGVAPNDVTGKECLEMRGKTENYSRTRARCQEFKQVICVSQED